MKIPSFITTIVCGFGLAPISAQDLKGEWKASTPITSKAEGTPKEEPPLYALQNPLTLDSQNTQPLKQNPVIDLDILRLPATHGKMERQMTRAGSAETVAHNLVLLSATYREIAKPDASANCSEIALTVKQRIKLDPAGILETVEVAITNHPSCACEIVKAAIQESGADPSLVTSIVEASIQAAPEHMRLIAQCAIAMDPGSLTAIQTLLAKLDPGGGDSSASAKSAKNPLSQVAMTRMAWFEKTPNPLDRPSLQVIPPIVPPLVTNVDP